MQQPHKTMATDSAINMAPFSLENLPVKVTVSSIVEGRYSGPRPASWDQRIAGHDLVTLADGSVIKLQSEGGQSVPQPGWVLMITSGDANTGYSWTLYGLPLTN